MRFRSLFTAISCISIIACGGNEDTSSTNTLCDPGSTQICVGPGVCEGVQVCNLNGSAWGECDCGGGEAGSPGTGGAETGGNSVETGGSGGDEPETGGSEGGSDEAGGSDNPTGGSNIGGADIGGAEPTGGTDPETGGSTGGTEAGGEGGAETGGTEEGAAGGNAETGGEAGSGTGGEVCVPLYDRNDPELACQQKAMELAGISIEDLQGGAEMPDACGYIDDGCGNPINCNGCAEYKGCGVGEIEFLEDAINGTDVTIVNKVPSLCQGGCVGMYNDQFHSAWIPCIPEINELNLSQIKWTTELPPFEMVKCYDETEDLAVEGYQLWGCYD